MSEVTDRLFHGARVRLDVGPCHIRLSNLFLIPFTFFHEMGHGVAYYVLFRSHFFITSSFMVRVGALPESFDAGFSVDPYVPAVPSWKDACVSAAGPAADAVVAGMLILGVRCWLADRWYAPVRVQDVWCMPVLLFAGLYALQALLNLLPLPGVDGGKVWAWVRRQPLRPPEAAAAFDAMWRRTLSTSHDPARVRRTTVKVFVDALRESERSPLMWFDHLEMNAWRVEHGCEPPDPG